MGALFVCYNKTMFRRTIYWVAVVTILALGILGAFFVLSAKDAHNDKSGIGALFAPADSYSRVIYGNKPVTLTYWRPSNDPKSIQPIIDEFQKLHPNVTIDLQSIDSGTYDAQLTQAAQAGNLPDIFSTLNDRIPRYEEYIAPAPETVYTEKVYNDVFVDVVRERLQKNGKIYGVSYGVSTLGLIYNSAILKEAGLSSPSDWTEFVEVSRKLTKKSGTTITRSGAALGTPLVKQSVDIQALLMIQNGAKLTDSPPTRASFAQPDSSGYLAGARALDFYTSFANPKLQNYAFSDTLGDSVQAFAEGKVAMMINYPFVSLEIKTLNPNLEFSVSKLPQIKNGQEKNFAVFWAEMVNRNSVNTEIAWDFLRFAATKDNMRKYGRDTALPTSRKDLVEEQKRDDVLAPFAGQIATAQTFYRGNDKEMNEYFYDGTTSILSGLDAQLAVQNLQRRATDLIRKYPQK